jgi:hypothetical protein
MSPTCSTLTVTIDYSLSLAAMIEAGHYNYVSPGITAERFPIIGTGVHKMEVVLVGFDREVFWPYVLDELRALGLRPAKIEHLLALGAQHPGELRKYPIDALGSVAVGADSAPFFGADPRLGADPRCIELIYLEDEETNFYPAGRRLAVRDALSPV